ncbi:hypothetical protein MW887_005984 [Aspergillus wentii]|nr:hypothetical protein MW887_005984 [Aspergillus wentii]
MWLQVAQTCDWAGELLARSMAARMCPELLLLRSFQFVESKLDTGTKATAYSDLPLLGRLAPLEAFTELVRNEMSVCTITFTVNTQSTEQLPLADGSVPSL